MKLYEVTNGYMGESYVRCLVVAPSEARALSMARERYEAAAGRRHHQRILVPQFTAELVARVLCEDVGQEWASEVTDG